MLPFISTRVKFILAALVIVMIPVAELVDLVQQQWFWPSWLGLAEAMIIFCLFDRAYAKRLLKIKEVVDSLRTNPENHIPVVEGEVGLVAEEENKLAASLRLSGQIFDNLPLAVIAFDQGGRKLICNRAAAAIFNCHGNCEESTCFRKQNDPDFPLYLLGRTFNKGDALEDQDFTFSFPGGHKHLWVRTDIIRGTGEKIHGALLIAWDITDRNHMEAQLHQAEKLSLVGELAAGMAHEILNPLTSVRGLTQVIASRFHGDNGVLEHTAVMLKEIDRINTIIKELLLLSKPSSPALSLVDLAAELDAVCGLLEGKAELQHVRIEKKFQKNLPLVVMDKDRMIQVFLNLSTNAISAMPEGGVLGIEARYKQSEGVFEIVFKDNGEGIPEENLKRIFDPFFTTKEEGTGLGLSVSYQIIRSHGGNIEVTSEPGQGSTFTIILPPLNMEQSLRREQQNLRAG